MFAFWRMRKKMFRMVIKLLVMHILINSWKHTCNDWSVICVYNIIKSLYTISAELSSFISHNFMFSLSSMAPSSVLITGANRGVGLEFVRQYAQLQPQSPRHVFAACRSPDSAKVGFYFITPQCFILFRLTVPQNILFFTYLSANFHWFGI
jgi:hypothetical protein